MGTTTWTRLVTQWWGAGKWRAGEMREIALTLSHTITAQTGGGGWAEAKKCSDRGNS